MLDRIRRPGRSLKEGSLKKIFSYFIFGLICLVFIFLAPMGSKILGEGVLANVGSESIRAGDLQFIEPFFKQKYQKRLETADENNLSEIQKEIRQRAVNELINQYLLVQGSEKAGFFVSNKELRENIRSIPFLKEKGRFLYSRYKIFLKSKGLSASRYEKMVRRELQAFQWSSLFKKVAVASHLERKKDEQRYAYKVNFQYALLNADEIEEERLEPFVNSKDIKKTNQFLKENKVEWEETGLFSLMSPFGVAIAQNQNIMEALIHQLPVHGLIPRFIRQNDKVYIVNVLSFTEKEVSLQEKQLQNLLNRNFDKSLRLLNSWAEVQKKKFEIKMSDNI